MIAQNMYGQFVGMTLAMQSVLFVGRFVLLVQRSAYGIPVLIHWVVVAALAVGVAIGGPRLLRFLVCGSPLQRD